jgi:DNA-directed RNA polymerase subunit RPC12/RpoP
MGGLLECLKCGHKWYAKEGNSYREGPLDHCEKCGSKELSEEM